MSIFIDENSQLHPLSSDQPPPKSPFEVSDLSPIKCPAHQSLDVVFICSLPSCENKLICHKCMEEDIILKRKHLIQHESYLLFFDKETINTELTTMNQKVERMKETMRSKEVVYLDTIVENLEESEFFKNLVVQETEEITQFCDKIVEQFKIGCEEYACKLLPVFRLKIEEFLKDVAADFVNFRKKYDGIVEEMKKSEDIYNISGTFESFEDFERFFVNLQYNNRIITDQMLWNELGRIYDKMEGFSFIEQNNFLKNEFFSHVLNEIMAKFSKNLLVYSMSKKEKEKEKENKENKENEKEETKKHADSLEFSKISTEEKSKSKTTKKRKRSRSSSCKSVNSIVSKSKSKEKPYKKPHSNTNSSSTTFMNKDPIYVKDLPYLLLNDFCIAGPLREEEFYLCACSNNELFISVWAMNRFNFSFQCSLYGHTKKPFKLIYNDNRKLLISAGMEWIIRVWDVLTWSIVCSFPEDYGPIQCLSFNPALDIIASYHDTRIRIWTTENKQIKTYSSFTCPVPNPQEILFFSESSPNCDLIKANYIVVGNFEGKLYFYLQDETNNYVNKQVTKKHRGAIYKLFYNKQRNIVISSGCDDNFIFFWDVGKFEMVQNFAIHDVKRIRGINHSADGDILIFTAGMDEIYFVDVNKCRLAGTYIMDGIEFMECVSAEAKHGKIIASFGKDGNRKNHYCIKIFYFEKS